MFKQNQKAAGFFEVNDLLVDTRCQRVNTFYASVIGALKETIQKIFDRHQENFEDFLRIYYKDRLYYGSFSWTLTRIKYFFKHVI